MLTIQSLKCIYDTGARCWAMELVFEGETATKRFDVDGAEDAKLLLEAFEESTSSTFNPETAEVLFAYEYLAYDDEDEEDDEETDDVSENDEDEDEDEDDDLPLSKDGKHSAA